MIDPSHIGADLAASGGGLSVFTFRLANISSTDAEFLSGIVRLFCDPDYAHQARLLRLGQLALKFTPSTGQVQFSAASTAAVSGDVIAFVARFHDDEWERCIATPGFPQAFRARDFSVAERIAAAVLGYTPEPVRVDFVKG